MMCVVRFSSAQGRSLVQRSPTGGVISKPQQRGILGPVGVVEPWEGKYHVAGQLQTAVA